MPTTDELQAQINALQQQLNQIIGMSNDDYVLTYSGEEVDDLLGKASAAVRYDLAQSLTAAQQAQARGNIAAMHGIESTDHPGCIYVVTSGVIEWVNPPLNLGVEYRTTERYLGKPVYKQVIDFGKLGNSTTKSVDVAVANVEKIPILGGTASEIPLMSGAYGGRISQVWAQRDAEKITVSITTTADLSWMSAVVLLGYTKTTD